ncbi:MAG: ABATE domain-containing protein [Acidobacteria bacterium]|jgi:predicted RNA-binding Zn ribbon-like protein|nr:ABATE domain-containing protein [Acidobacteriota bacterium]
MTSTTTFAFSAGALCLDFANTWGNRGDPCADRLGSYPDLVNWACQGDLIDDRGALRLERAAGKSSRATGRVFDQAVALREAVYGVFSALARGDDPDPAAIDVLNRLLASALPRLRLAPGGACCRWQWSGPEDSLDRMLWPVARSAADLLTSELVGRVRECASPSCSWLFLDRSRNGRRKWCDMATCGNRAKARRYYRRHRPGRGVEAEADG